MAHCDRVQARLNAFLEGTLGAAQAQELNLHLQICPVCEREYQALKATQALVRNVVVPDGAAAKHRVMVQFREALIVSALKTGKQAKEGTTVPASSPWLTWRARLLPLSTAGAAGLLCVFMLIPRSPVRTQSGLAGGMPVVLATAACSPSLPTPNDLDQMTYAHAIQSFTVQNGSEELQEEALADANSRLLVIHK